PALMCGKTWFQLKAGTTVSLVCAALLSSLSLASAQTAPSSGTTAGSFDAKAFLGAPAPQKSGKASPLNPADEQATFTLPPGFQIELVASESEGIGKFVTVDWDQHGRMWSMTALE